jgi:AcrR family transcriptional regulator
LTKIVQEEWALPKVVDHDAYRLELLERAAPLFVEIGYDSLTTRQLCRHLGVSTGTLYHYFPSKEKFFEALARHWMTQDLSWVRECFENLPPGPERVAEVAGLLQSHRGKFNTQNHLVLQFCQRQQQLGNDLTEFWDGIYQGWAELTREVLGLRSIFAGLLLCQVVDGVFMQWIQGGGCPSSMPRSYDLKKLVDHSLHMMLVGRFPPRIALAHGFFSRNGADTQGGGQRSGRVELSKMAGCRG